MQHTKEGLGGLAASVARLRTQLAEAERTLAVGDTIEAERQAKAVSALVRATRDVAELEAEAVAQSADEDDEELRAEIRRRLDLFIEAARAGDPDERLEQLARETFAG